MNNTKLTWHPFTQEQTADLPICITKAKGAYLYDNHNKKYLDLISSWWVNLHGHAHPDIAKAIYDQALILEQVIFAGFTHEPATILCDKLHTILPTALCHFFFSDNGSTAVEIALKMARQYWWNHQETQRTTFISFDGGYHGDTFGAMSVGYKSGFYTPFTDLLFKGFYIPFPATWQDDDQLTTKEDISLSVLSDYLKIHHHHIAGFIAEPLVQGASGMRICRPEYLTRVIKLLREYNILIIFDEVMTGFGRTGKNFALEYISVNPDILCLAKGLTGGFLPLALTVATDKIYQAFLSDEFSKAFAHGHSYTANPLGCAASIASLDLLTRASTQASITRIANQHLIFLDALQQKFPNVIKCCRSFGTIAAFNLENTESDYNFNKVSLLKRVFIEHGLLVRPLGNVIYLIPPYCITEHQLNIAYEEIIKILHQRL